LIPAAPVSHFRSHLHIDIHGEIVTFFVSCDACLSPATALSHRLMTPPGLITPHFHLLLRQDTCSLPLQVARRNDARNLTILLRVICRNPERLVAAWIESSLVFDQITLKVGCDMDNRRKTIVINKPFQYQHSLLIAALAVLLVNGFIILRVLFPGEQPLQLSTQLTIGIATVEFVLIAAIWYGSLRASHRIAGPVYVFAREIARLGEGDLNASIVLRDRDMFQSEAEQINKSIAALRSRIAAVKGLSEQLQKAHPTGADVGPIVEKLAAELSLFTFGNNS